MNGRENKFQASLVKELHTLFPEAIITKMDSGKIQGIPDILILNGPNWATLEVKRSATEHHQPNQDYYVAKMNRMSFSRFIFPENKEEVLNDLQQAFRTRRRTRLP